MFVQRHVRTAALVASLCAGVATGANAQEVTLTSEDGKVVIRGTITNWSDEFYEIDTDIGLFEIDTRRVSCEGSTCPDIKPPTSEFNVSGSGDLSDRFMPALLEAYATSLSSDMTIAASSGGPMYTITDAEEDDLARVRVAATASTQGISDLLQGNALVALSSRPVRRREADAFDGSGLGNLRTPQQEHVVALDGLVIVTAKDNPLRAITERDAALVFSGFYTNWSQIGGPDAPINLYFRAENSGSAEVFFRLLMNPQGVGFAQDATIGDTDEDVGRLVAADPNGIGFTSFAGRGDAKPLAIQGVCGLLSEPSEFNIKTEEYPLTRRLYAYTTNQKAPHYLEGFLDFTASAAAQAAIDGAGFVDQAITTSTVSDQGMRFASAILSNQSPVVLRQLRLMVADMMSSSRLSTTFRFETGSSRLDSRALDDIVRLADELSSDTTFRKVVQLIGFTDAVGDAALNAQLSQRRAGQVQAALLQARPELADRIEFRSIGYGEVSPIACNETAEGRRINRRVEVWIRDAFGGQTQ